MRSARNSVSLRRAPLGGLALLLTAGVATGDDLGDLEALTDDTIRAACHGFVFDSMLRTLQELFAPDSSYCRAVREAEEVGAMPARRRHVELPSGTDYRARDDARVRIEMECEMEYHCVRQRQRALDLGKPLSLEEFRALEEACEKEPSCIEDALLDYPEIRWPERKAETQEEAVPAQEAVVADELPAESATVDIAAAPPPSGPAAGPPKTEVASGGGTYDLRVSFVNDGPARLLVGPFPVDVRCPDGSMQRIAFGAPQQVEPGASLDAEVFHVPAREVCRGEPATTFDADPWPPVVQPGIGGFPEQRATCPDGSRRLIAIGMVGDGQSFVARTLGGSALTVTADTYDARTLLATACGTGIAGLGERRAFVAEGKAYLSRDFSRFVTAWTDFCRQDPAGCLALYRDRNGPLARE